MSRSDKVRHKSAKQRLLMAMVVFSSLGAGVIASQGSSSAAVTAVTGSAYGYYSSIGLFGGSPTSCGSPATTPCPNPAVALPAAGSATALPASLPSEDLVYGPAHIFDSGPIHVSTQGTPASGTVTSSSTIAGCATAVSGGCNAGQIYAGPFTATSVSSTCTATSTTPTGSVTINGGQLAEEPTGGGPNGTPGPPIIIPTNPKPNDTVTATFPDTGKVYKYVFNEQTVVNGVLTINAAHEYLNGGSTGAQGDLIFGQVVCGLTGTPTTTTTTTKATTTTTRATTTTTTTPVSAASPVAGSAFGYYAKVSLFGGPPSSVGPKPTVTLPAGGSASPVTASAASGSAAFGPATIFTSGPIALSTQGTPASGSVTTSASVQNVGTGGGGGFSANQATSTCTANKSGTTGSTTLTNGHLVTSTDSNGNPATTVAVPVNPPPNDTIFGTINNVGGSFKYVFNEQIVNPNGSITVNAGHEYLGGGPNNHGPALGDLIFGQSVCARSASLSTVSANLANTTGASTPATAPAATASPAGTGALAFTGTDTARLIWLAILLLVAGCGALWLAAGLRRRGGGLPE